jgi:arsenite/tail-anchored protein-transporting ATPase
MTMIDKSMSQFLAERPGLKYVFFGGKGGVGKTVMAGAAALHFAALGKRTLLASTNPVHSLSNMLDQNVFGCQAPVKGTENLLACEIDTAATIDKS